MPANRPSWRRAAAGLLLAAALAGCAGTAPDFAIPPGVEDPLSPSRAALASGNYIRAGERLTKFLQENPGSILIDEANYLLGRATLGQKDRVLAADYFQKVVRDFPQSRFAPEAAYYQAVCYDQLSRPAQLDQDWTERAIGSYRLFAARYPDRPEVARAQERIKVLNDRLAEKALLNADLYLRMNAPAAAQIYFERVLREFPESRWACSAALGLGQVQARRRLWNDAITRLQQVLETCPDPDIRHRAEKALSRARSELARNPAPADTAGAADSAAAPR